MKRSKQSFQQGKQKKVIVTLLFILGVAWLISASEPIAQGLKLRLYGLIAPVLDEGNEFRKNFEKLRAEVETSKELAAKVELLEFENTRLSILEKNYRQLELNRNELRSLLGYQVVSTQELVPAEIIGRTPGHWIKAIHINVGSDQGIEVGMPVVTPEGLVGSVASVQSHISTVRLLSDEASQVSVKLLGTSEFGVVAGTRHQFGEGGQNLSLKFLSPHTRYFKGMKVLTSGKSEIYPEGLTVGLIENISYQKTSAEAVVRMAVDIKEAQYLFVIKE